ncbi:hypothetical protein CROQUDRAFT_36064 [Cronartium quercuum f. sp. fusiforme G11]|uniref:Fumarylacetoacetase n=1 Tax=Cronartium quercuum f. sp. fusiforme G11 TaxID=708437 RepID=A0A9P6THL8_9BASI|nr:hypothetical protein CROQUDRAFT_36064 [Cronartium quercuum f. sp. fusiforme G11]
MLQADSSLANDGMTRTKLFHSQAEVTIHLPLDVGDYTDFFASEDHMINAATIFVGSRDNAMLLNWSHVPMAYHGRSSTIIVSRYAIARPVGQTRPGSSSDGIPCFGPTSQFDYELEVGYVIGGLANARGEPISLSRARDRIFGALILFCLEHFSAREIQAWESYPLGPFLGKNFATTISAWVVQAEALGLATFSCEPQAPAPLPYLQEREPTTWDLEVVAKVRGAEEAWTRTSVSNLKTLRWTAIQMITHHSVGGCCLRPGDLLGTGTISGNTVESLGCLLERTRGGTETWSLKHGQKRTWLEDGDLRKC